MDFFHFVHTVFSPQKFIQVEDFQRFSPHVGLGWKAGSSEEGCGDCSLLRVPQERMILSSAATPDSGLPGWATAAPWGRAELLSGRECGCEVPAAQPVWGSRRLSLEMAARQNREELVPPALSSAREWAVLQQAWGSLFWAWWGYTHPEWPCSPHTEHTSWKSGFLF